MMQYNTAIPIAKNQEGQIISLLPECEINGITGVTGPPGAGKTMLLTYATRILMQSYPVITMSPHEDLASALGGGLMVTEDGIGPYSINPVALTTASLQRNGAVGSVNKIIDNLERSGAKFGSQQRGLLFNILLNAAKELSSWDPLDGHHPRMTLISLTDALSEEAKNAATSRSRDIAETLLTRLMPLASMPIFTGGNELDAAAMIQHKTVFNLSRMKGTGRTLVCDTILGMIIDHAFSLAPISHGQNKIRLFINIDEAKILFGDKDRKNDIDHPINVLATEGRKFGIGLILASQRAEHFSEDFLCNAAANIVLGPVTDAREKKKLGSIYGLDKSAIDQLSVRGSVYISSSLIPGNVYTPLL